MSEQLTKVPQPTKPGPLETALRARRDAGGKCLVPYVTGGFGSDWPMVVEAFAAAGADAVEVGLPFSDPVMDGPTVQQASEEALAAGATPASIIDRLATHDAGVPIAAMTYYNLVFRDGHRRFAQRLKQAGVAAALVPDLPLDELGPWAESADAVGIETVLLAAPTASDERLERICLRARGFVYGVGLLGVTGTREVLAESALVIARRLKAITDMPVLVGVGVSNADQAAEICEVADGVVIGSAIMQRLIDGAGPEGVGEFVAGVRARLDAG